MIEACITLRHLSHGRQCRRGQVASDTVARVKRHIQLRGSAVSSKSAGLRATREESFPATGLERRLGFQEVEAPEFLDSRHMKVVKQGRKGDSNSVDGRLCADSRPCESPLCLQCVRCRWRTCKRGHIAVERRLSTFPNLLGRIGKTTKPSARMSCVPFVIRARASRMVIRYFIA